MNFLAPFYSSNVVNHLATVDSWRSDFRGSAATVLLATIKGYVSMKEEVCALCASIVNSSGMGKSRLVSQLALTVIVLQICLRFGSNGTCAMGGLDFFYAFTFFRLSRAGCRTERLASSPCIFMASGYRFNRPSAFTLYRSYG